MLVVTTLKNKHRSSEIYAVWVCVCNKSLKSSCNVPGSFLAPKHTAGNWPKSCPLGVYIPLRQIESKQQTHICHIRLWQCIYVISDCDNSYTSYQIVTTHVCHIRLWQLQWRKTILVLLNTHYINWYLLKGINEKSISSQMVLKLH